MELPLEERRVLLERLEAEEHEFEVKKKSKEIFNSAESKELLKSFRKQNGCIAALRSSPNGDEIFDSGRKPDFMNADDLSSKTSLYV